MALRARIHMLRCRGAGDPLPDARLDAAVYADPAGRAAGLAGRRAPLAPGEAALFVFPGPTRTPFTLAATHLPLDVLFLDAAGVVVGFAPAVPALAAAPVVPPAPYVMAVECAAGTFAPAAPGAARGAPSTAPAVIEFYAPD